MLEIGYKGREVSMSGLQDEFKFYLENKSRFEAEYLGKYIVLKDKALLGVYDDAITAVNETKKSHELGTFLVQHVNSSETQVRFNSRYAIAK